MTPNKQLNLHDPAAGVIGDCWRTCIACLLDKSPSDVPHFVDGCWDDAATAARRTRQYLATLGLNFIEYPMQAELTDVLRSVGSINPDQHYLLSGNSRNGTGHTVVCYNDQIVWDPSRDESGIVGPMDDGLFWIVWLTPLALTATDNKV